MNAAKVPQHLELEDVVAWGLGAVDLLWLVGGVAGGWWLYLALPGDVPLRVVAAVPVIAFGAGLGIARYGDLTLRRWGGLALRFALRPRLLVTRGAT